MITEQELDKIYMSDRVTVERDWECRRGSIQRTIELLLDNVCIASESWWDDGDGDYEPNTKDMWNKWVERQSQSKLLEILQST